MLVVTTRHCKSHIGMIVVRSSFLSACQPKVQDFLTRDEVPPPTPDVPPLFLTPVDGPELGPFLAATTFFAAPTCNRRTCPFIVFSLMHISYVHKSGQKKCKICAKQEHPSVCALHISGNTRRVHLWISRNVRDNGRHQEGRGGGDKLRTNFFVPAFAAAPPMSFFFFDAPVPPAPLSSSSSSPTPLSRPPRGSGFMHKMSSAALMRFISGCTVQKCTIISTQVHAFVGSNTHTCMHA